MLYLIVLPKRHWKTETSHLGTREYTCVKKQAFYCRSVTCQGAQSTYSIKIEIMEQPDKEMAVDSWGQFYVRWDCFWNIKRGYALKIDQKHNILPKFGDSECIMPERVPWISLCYRPLLQYNMNERTWYRNTEVIYINCFAKHVLVILRNIGYVII